jgi:hypothetical protein
MVRGMRHGVPSPSSRLDLVDGSPQQTVERFGILQVKEMPDAGHDQDFHTVAVH